VTQFQLFKTLNLSDLGDVYSLVHFIHDVGLFVLKKYPSAHLIQDVAPDDCEVYVPSGHGKHAVVPLSLLNVSVGQEIHEVWAASTEYLPGGQDLQADWDESSEYLPGGHCMQADWDSCAVYVPAGQCLHSAALPLLHL
jgi:hypothetical protein